MQRLCSFLFIAMISAIAATGQTKQEEQEKILTALVETMRKAMVDADSTVLNKITAEGLSYGHSNAHIENKAEFVGNIASGKYDFVDIDLTEQTVYVSGKTAIVRHKLSAHTNDVGKGPAVVNLGVLLVFQKDNKEWKLLARQAVKLQ